MRERLKGEPRKGYPNTKEWIEKEKLASIPKLSKGGTNLELRELFENGKSKTD